MPDLSARGYTTMSKRCHFWASKRSHLRPRPHSQLSPERLEDRLVPSTLEVPLDSLFDEFGNQFETVQVYDNNDGLGPRVTFGIFDTGASPITYGSEDQFQFDEFGQGIPTLPGVEVGASGVGGDLTGLVSQPGTISADGMHAFDIAGLLDFEGDGGLGVDLSHAASVDGVRP